MVNIPSHFSKATAAFLFWAITIPTASARTLIDRMVAIVDQQPILYSTVMEKVEKGPLILVSDYPAENSAKDFEKALQDTINLELVLKRSEELEIEVDDEKIDQQIESLTKYNNISVEQLKQYLAEQGKTFEDYRQDLRRQIIYMRFKGRELVPKIKITDRDVEAYYLKKNGTISENVAIFVRYILIAIPPNTPPEVVESKQKVVEQVYKKLKDGMNFLDAVRIYSDHPGARNETSAIKLKLNDLPSALRVEVSKLEPGNFTAPIKTDAGFQIIFLEDKKFTVNEEFLAQKSNLEQELREKQLAELTRSWLENARQRAKIKIIPN